MKKQNKKIFTSVILALSAVAVGAIGGVAFQNGNLLDLRAASTSSVNDVIRRVVMTYDDFVAADPDNDGAGTITVNGIAFSFTGTTHANNTLTMATGGKIDNVVAAGQDALTSGGCKGACFTGFALKGFSTSSGTNTMAYGNETGSAKTWYKMINERSDVAAHRGNTSETADTVDYSTPFDAGWEVQRNDQDNTPYWIEVPQLGINAVSGAFSFTEISATYLVQPNTTDTWVRVYFGQKYGVYSLTGENGDRLHEIAKVGSTYKFKLVKASGYDTGYTFHVGASTTRTDTQGPKSGTALPSTTYLTAVDGVYSLTLTTAPYYINADYAAS